MHSEQDSSRRKASSAFGTVAALAALVIGLCLGMLDHALQIHSVEAVRVLLEPLGYLWLNALQMTVMPLVVANLILAVVRAGSATEIGWLGAASFGLFVTFLLSIGALTALSLPAVVAQLQIDDVTVSSLSVLSEQAQAVIEASDVKPSFALWLVELMPPNPFEALVEDDLLPVLMFTILFALALGRTEAQNRDIVLGFFRAVSEAMLILVRWILVFTPLGVFALALSLGTSIGGTAAGLVVQYLLLICGALLVAVLLLYPVTALLGGVSIAAFARGVLPAQIVALGTRSSLASLPALLEGAESRLRIDPEVARLTLPLAVSVFKLNQPVSSTLKVLLVAHVFAIDVTGAQLVAFMLTILIMSFSTIGVPLGGGAMRTLPAYLAVGIPVEAIILFEAVEAIPDVFKTLLNVTGDMSVALVANTIMRRVITGAVPPADPSADHLTVVEDVATPPAD